MGRVWWYPSKFYGVRWPSRSMNQTLRPAGEPFSSEAQRCLSARPTKIKVITRRSKLRRLGLGAILFAGLCAPVCAQDADSSSSSQSEASSSSLSADDIISALRQDPKLLRQVKDDAVQKAQEQGRTIDPDDLTDESLFQMIRDDRGVRILAGRAVQKQSSSDLDNSDGDDTDNRGSRPRRPVSGPDDNNLDSSDGNNPDNREWKSGNPRDSSNGQNRESMNPALADQQTRVPINGKYEDQEPVNAQRQFPLQQGWPENRLPL